MKTLSVEEMLKQEQAAILSGISVDQLLQNAGQNLAKVIERRFSSGPKSIVALVGRGNNGGDALVALSHLTEHGWKARALIMTERSDVSLVHQAVSAGVEILEVKNVADPREMADLLDGHSILLDALLGTGFSGSVRPELAALMRLVYQALPWLPRRPFIVAVDCPSGVNCSTGQADPEVLPADLTICMAACKQGLLLQPAFSFVGELASAGIGIEILNGAAGLLEVVEAEDVKAVLPERSWNAHKGTAGRLVVCGGSVEYVGAPVLSGLGAYAVGAGLVRMVVPSIVQTSAATMLPEAIWTLMPTTDGVMAESGTELLMHAIKGNKALVFGPGMGQLPASQKLVRSFFTRLAAGAEHHSRPLGFGRADPYNEQVDSGSSHNVPPIVVDADGLRSLTALPQWWCTLPPGSVITPHPGEMAALTGRSVADVQSDRLETARNGASNWGCIVVLKGAQTVVAEPGGRAAIIPISAPALAKAGTGDVLAGVIGALLAQGVDSFSAAWAGAWLHARAGLALQVRHGNNRSPMASELPWGLRRVLSDLVHH